MTIEYRWAEGQLRSVAGVGGRSGPPPGGRDRHAGHRRRRSRPRPRPWRFRSCSYWGRSGQARSGRQPQPARRQCDRRQLLVRRAGGQAPGAAARAAARGRTVGCAGQSDQVRTPRRAKRRGGGGGGLGLQILISSQHRREIDAAFASWCGSGPMRSSWAPIAFFVGRRVNSRRWRRATRLPAVFTSAIFAEAGGLMSYGSQPCRAFARPASIPAASQRRQACRPAGGAVDQVRVGHQPPGPPDARPRRARQHCSPAPTR